MCVATKIIGLSNGKIIYKSRLFINGKRDSLIDKDLDICISLRKTALYLMD